MSFFRSVQNHLSIGSFKSPLLFAMCPNQFFSPFHCLSFLSNLLCPSSSISPNIKAQAAKRATAVCPMCASLVNCLSLHSMPMLFNSFTNRFNCTRSNAFSSQKTMSISYTSLTQCSPHRFSISASTSLLLHLCFYISASTSLLLHLCFSICN